MTDTGAPVAVRPRGCDYVCGLFLCWAFMSGIYVVYLLGAALFSIPSAIDSNFDNVFLLILISVVASIVTAGGVVVIGLPTSLLLERLLRRVTHTIPLVLAYVTAGFLGGAVLVPAIVIVIQGGDLVADLPDAMGQFAGWLGTLAAVSAGLARWIVQRRMISWAEAYV